MEHDKAYWDNRYVQAQTQWNVGEATRPLKIYFDQLEDKSLKVLIPGCGNAYEAEYLHLLGFENIYVADISALPLQEFADRCPGFPTSHLLHVDFFDLSEKFDMIIEQTFFCALHPTLRDKYVKQCHHLLVPEGRLVGLLFDAELNKDQPPYGGSAEVYTDHFAPYFEFKTFERCYNSIDPRMNRELFINLIRK